MIIVSGNALTLHGATGYAALAFMGFTTYTADKILRKPNDDKLKAFPKQMLLAWLIWLIPFTTRLIH
jgi:hypothetical protein